MIQKATQGRLTTHVLDTGQGCPAAGLRIELFRLEQNARTALKAVTTNADGRTDAPLLEGADLTAGYYELVFHAGSYIKANTDQATSILFLDQIPIRFGIDDAGAHYHVPLLLSPFGYTTYRGS